MHTCHTPINFCCNGDRGGQVSPHFHVWPKQETADFLIGFPHPLFT